MFEAPQADNPVDRLPGTWLPVQEHNKITITFACPHGHLGRIDPSQFYIDKRGQVFPSVPCYKASCSFHEWVTLLNWNPAWSE